MTMGRGRLPGGLPVWRGWALVLGRTRGYWPFVVCLVVVLAHTVLFVRRVVDLVLWLVIIATGIAGWTWVFWSIKRLAPEIAADDQPDLARLVAEVVVASALRPPDRIRLIGRPYVRVRVKRRRRELVIGTPMLDCLSRVELRALVARELAIDPGRPWLVARLRGLWTDAVEANLHTAELDKEDAPSRTDLRRWRRAARLERALGAFGGELHRRAWLAAVRSGGSDEVASRAYAAESLAAHGFMQYLVTAGLVWPAAWRDRAILDVDEGWRQVLTHDSLVAEWGQHHVERLERLHPGLPELLGRLASGHRLRLSSDPVRLTQLSTVDRQQLARSVLLLGRQRPAGWITFDEAPLDWWERRAAEDGDGVRAAVARRLGRAPVDDVEVARDVCAFATDEFPAGEAPMAIRYLLDHILIRRGWQPVHPAVRGVLVGPAGERVDARDLVGGTMAAPDLSAFAAVVSPSVP